MTKTPALLAAILAIAPLAARAQTSSTSSSTGTAAPGQTTKADRADPRANPPSNPSADKPADTTTDQTDRIRAARKDEGTRSDKMMTDEQVLAKLHHVNQEEIKAGQLAQKNGSTQQVKDYGQMLVTDHQKADKQVQQVATKMHVELSSQNLDQQQMEKMKVHQNKLEQLRAMKGKEFDRGFAQMMSNGHQEVIDMVKNAQANAKSDMKTLLDGLLPDLQKHKDVADQILSSTRSTASAK
jgi:putative membrane protein